MLLRVLLQRPARRDDRLQDRGEQGGEVMGGMVMEFDMGMDEPKDPDWGGRIEIL